MRGSPSKLPSLDDLQHVKVNEEKKDKKPSRETAQRLDGRFDLHYATSAVDMNHLTGRGSHATLRIRQPEAAGEGWDIAHCTLEPAVVIRVCVVCKTFFFVIFF